MNEKKICSCDRRSFLKGSGLALTGFGLSSLFPSPFMRHAMAAGTGDERLLFIFLRGGNDGINALIPHGDPDYSLANRKTLYFTPPETIDLNGFAAFHPALADMMDLYNDGELAAIHRVGRELSDLSHFDEQRVWENGKPLQPNLFEGWLARYVAEHAAGFDGDLPVLTAQREAPVLVRGRDAHMNISDPAGFYNLQGSLQTRTIRDWRRSFNELGGLQAYRPLLSQTGVKLMDTLDEYRTWSQQTWDPKDPDNPTWSLFPVDNASNPPDPGGPNGLKFSPDAYPFFNNVKIAALALLESAGTSNGTRVAGTELNGWDLHSEAGKASGRHAELLSWLAYAFRSLRIVLSGAAIDPRAYAGIWDRTVVVTLSEFGRTTITNSGHGTDHGSASCLWVAGQAVNGGVYNCDSSSWPSGVMFGNSGRYLLYNTDFRAIFWEVLRDHMGVDLAKQEMIFPGYGSDGLGAQELGLIDTTP